LLQTVLGFVEQTPPFVVLFRSLHRVEWHDDVLFASSQEAANADDESRNFPRLIDENVIDVTNLDAWLTFVFAMNSVSPPIGQRDMYLFTLAPSVIDKPHPDR
jgi:hypothetical protein